MKLTKYFATVFIASLMLSACGGGGTDSGGLVSSGGTGGTGIASGTVSGFGSIFVNGIEFDVSNATLVRDETETSNEDDFSIGEVVTVSGSIDDASGTGVADSVSFETLLAGPVTATGTATMIEILGQPVSVAASTVFENFTALADLSNGDQVKVSGFHAADRTILATYIKRLTSAPDEIIARVYADSVDNGTQRFSANNLVVDYGSAERDFEPLNGDFIKVRSTLAFNDPLLTASRIQLITDDDFDDGTEIEIEGLITSFTSSSAFTVANQPVITDAGTLFEDGTPDMLGLDVRVEAEGIINANGVLVADRIEFENEDLFEETRSTANIDSIDAVAQTIELLTISYTINASSDLEDKSDAEIDPLTFADLQVGDRVEVRASDLSADLPVIELRRLDLDPTDPDLLEGPVSSANSADGSLVIHGLQITTNGTTVYRGPNDNAITKESFFSSIIIDTSHVKAKGVMSSATTFLAEELSIEN